jgi:hypothetical protein
VLFVVSSAAANINNCLLLKRLNFEGMCLTDTNRSMIVRVAKNSSRNQALSVKRVGGAAGRLCDSPHSPLQSLGASQELRLASSDFLEVALDCKQLRMGLTCELAQLVAPSADSLRINARSDMHFDQLRLAGMRLIQSTVLFDVAVRVVGRVVDDEIGPRLMCHLKIILQALKMPDILELQIDALALEFCFEALHLCLVQKLGAIVFVAKALHNVGSLLSILERVIGNMQIGARERPSLQEG